MTSTMPSRFSDHLRRRGEAIWARCLTHPFVRGIGDGTLPLEKFRFYLSQDYLFLIEFARVLALASAKAPDLETQGRFAELLHATLNVEMDLHRKYSARFGVSGAALARTKPAPTTVAYTRHLLSLAYSGSLGEVAAGLFPCMWGYAEIGLALAKRQKARGRSAYREWVATYSSREYLSLARWAKGLLDRLGSGAGNVERAKMEEAFLTSSRYELAFWEMAWVQERWPL